MPLFSRPKYDVVVVAARYGQPGRLDWVRAFVRRGPTWSDRVKISRAELIDRVRAGERVFTGSRSEYQASTFEVRDEVRVQGQGEQAFLLAGPGQGQKDDLQSVPVL